MRLHVHRLSFALLAVAPLAQADNAVVGSGAPASCNEAALDAALAQVVVGTQGPGGTLAFNCGAAPHTIAITAQKLLQGQVAIDGGGRITLDAQNLSRHFLVSLDGADGRTEVALRGLTLTGGLAAGDFGGAILARSGVRLDLARVTIRDSRAGLSGGAIGIEPGDGRLDIADSLFTQNRANDGGAIASSVTTTVTRSRFFGNSADANQGGAIQHWIEDLRIDDSVFGANAALRGGAIYKRGGDFTVQGSRLQDNLARADGGAIYAEAGVERLSVTLSYFDRNLADADGGAILAGHSLELFVAGFDGNRARRGGALRLADSEFASVAYSLFVDNEAETGGGAIAVSATPRPGAGNPPVLLVSDSTFSGNRVSGVGGVGGDVFSTAGSAMVTAITGSTLIGAQAAIGSALFAGNGNVAVLAANLLWTASGDTCHAEGTATLTSGGDNLGPVANCDLSESSDGLVLSFADFELDPLADHGGPLRTFLPRVASPAVDRRDCGSLDQIDMRLLPRPVDGNGDGTARCDAGAVERQRSERPASLFRHGFEAPAMPGGA